MKTTYFFIVLLMAAALVIIGTGCGGGSDTASGDGSANAYPADSIVNVSPVATTSPWRITKVEFKDIGETIIRTDNFTYDSNGFLVKIEKESDVNRYLNLTFNSEGFLTQLISGDGAGDVTTRNFTYSEGKLLTLSENDLEEGDNYVYTFDQWIGYFPTHASIVRSGSSSGTDIWTGTIDSNGRFISGSITSPGGTSITRNTISYGDATVRDLREDFSGSAWIATDDCSYSYDVNGRQTKNELSEYDDDGSYQIKTLEYTYDTNGNISVITITRENYNSSGVFIGTESYTANITYISATSRPAPNDILYRSYNSFIEYAVEYLD